MKPATKNAAEAIRQALLGLPDRDLSELIDYWLELVANLDPGGEIEEMLRSSAGYQLVEEDGYFEYVTPSSC